jgi:putative tryptophan/tyrosine transport system substrate-binding protein
MRRRDFVKLLSSAAAAWPGAVFGQQSNHVRRIGVLMGWAETDPYAQAALAAFLKELQQLGWADGRNLRIDLRWAAGDAGRMKDFAKELVDLRPEMILANTTPATAALHEKTRTIPVVFVIVSDPIGAGFVASLPLPGGNITGFINVETSMAGKWLELLKEIAPAVRRVAILFNPDTAPGGGSYFLGPFEAAARSFGVEAIRTPARSDAEIETVIAGLGREPGSGLVVMTDGFMVVHRGSIISLAARDRVPAIYAEAFSSRDGGLMSYGANTQDAFDRAASYADRILRGARPADLPVQTPTKFELAINLKTAKALSLNVPPTLLARADEVIE